MSQKEALVQMRKHLQCLIEIVDNLIEDGNGEIPESDSIHWAQKENKKKIVDCLNRLGISSDRKGYDYLVEAIEERMKRLPENKNNKYNQIIEHIASKRFCTFEAVNGSIRTALGTCSKKDVKLCRAIFGGDELQSPAKFIKKVANYLYYESSAK